MAKTKPRTRKVGFSKWLLSLLGIGTLAGAALIGSSLFSAMNSLDDRSYAASRRMPVTGTVCWDRVISYNGRLMWSDGCRGRLNAEACTQAFTPLSETEMALYKQWITQGKPIIAGCAPGLPRPSSRPGATTKPTTPPRVLPKPTVFGDPNLGGPSMTGRPVRTAQPVQY